MYMYIYVYIYMYIYIYIYICMYICLYININMKTKMIVHINDVLYNEMCQIKNESNYFVTCKYFRLIL